MNLGSSSRTTPEALRAALAGGGALPRGALPRRRLARGALPSGRLARRGLTTGALARGRPLRGAALGGTAALRGRALARRRGLPRGGGTSPGAADVQALLDRVRGGA